jgi:hypothetical protein
MGKAGYGWARLGKAGQDWPKEGVEDFTAWLAKLGKDKNGWGFCKIRDSRGNHHEHSFILVCGDRSSIRRLRYFEGTSSSSMKTGTAVSSKT